MGEETEEESSDSEKAKEKKQETENKENNREPDSDEKYCSSCGDIIDEDAEICPECGVRVKEKSESSNVNINMENNQVQNQGGEDQITTSNKSKGLAGLLGIFLGTLGAHKFYLGQAGRGFIFLLLSATGISTIVGFIQGVSYLMMSEQKFARKFG